MTKSQSPYQLHAHNDTMAILQYLRRLYSLDTLDTRLTVPSSTSLKAAAVVNTNKQAHDDGAQSIANATPPPRWKTPEFFFYYFIFITVVPLMFKTVIDVSQESHPTYPLYSHLLSPGWVPGRKVVSNWGSVMTTMDADTCFFTG